MKKFSIMIVGVLVSAFTFAGLPNESFKTNSGMAVVKTNTTSYKLIYKSEEASDVKIEIFDARKKLVFSETIKKSNGFARPYNFENLTEGEYTIRLDNGSNWMTETVDYKTERNIKLAHLTNLKDGKYLLTVAGERENRLSIRIFSDEGNLIREDVEPVFGNFAQVYDLRSVPGGFSIVISDTSGATKVLTGN